ncbi:Prefoldin subunit 4 [Talaromyces pinophilus]|nr:Prefoldin subunit 4 [Talaromyces pinophilus]
MVHHVRDESKINFISNYFSNTPPKKQDNISGDQQTLQNNLPSHIPSQLTVRMLQHRMWENQHPTFSLSQNHHISIYMKPESMLTGHGNKLSKDEEAATGTEDTEVRREDQDKINRFSRLHQRETVLEERLKAKQKDKEDLEEVSTELELADEDELVPYKIGDSFIHLPLEQAQSLLSTSTDEIDAEVSRLEDALGEIREELSGLKAALYARFGKAINLDV